MASSASAIKTTPAARESRCRRKRRQTSPHHETVGRGRVVECVIPATVGPCPGMNWPISAVLIGEPSVRFLPAAAGGLNQAAREAGDPPSLVVGEAVEGDLDVQGNVERALRARDLPAALHRDRLSRPAVAIDLVAAHPGVGRVALIDTGRRARARFQNVARVGLVRAAPFDGQLGLPSRQVTRDLPRPRFISWLVLDAKRRRREIWRGQWLGRLRENRKDKPRWLIATQVQPARSQLWRRPGIWKIGIRDREPNAMARLE